MNRAELQERLVKTAAKTLGVVDSMITITTKKDDFFEWDSLGHTILLLGIEQEFKVKFSLDEISNADSIEKLLELLGKKYQYE